MAYQTWVVGEMLVDLLLLGLLSYVVLRLRQRKAGAGLAHDGKVISVVQEMQQLRQELERNLSEKRELTAKLLRRLEHRLSNAEDLSRNLEGLLAQAKKLSPKGGDLENYAGDARREAVLALRARGVSAAEIASILQLSLGEVRLMLKLEKRTELAG